MSTNQPTVTAAMEPTDVMQWCAALSQFFFDLPSTLKEKTKDNGVTWVNDKIKELGGGVINVQMSVVKMLTAKMEKLPAQIEEGIRNASKQTADQVTSSLQASLPKPTMAEIVKRNSHVLILKPANGEDQTLHRKSNRELSEVSNVMRAALEPINNQVKLNGIRATANNGVVVEFASAIDRDIAKVALDQCTTVTKYQVNSPRKPCIVIKSIPQEATDDDVLDAIGDCPGVVRANCSIVKKMGDPERPTRPYLVEVSEEDKLALLNKKYVMVGGFSRCLVEEQSNQCFACYGFGHIAAHCDKQRCDKCAASGHQTKDCTAVELACCNCVEKKIDGANGRQHGAFQTWICPVAKGAMSQGSRRLPVPKNAPRARATQ